ncbi:MAG: NAD-dependent epimerase/dehydratase family protein [Deltaproteobacteria bacterium]|nr:NAD-dependent epimerase/dehydratase family protein [Deltaproteobacteria bacterium]
MTTPLDPQSATAHLSPAAGPVLVTGAGGHLGANLVRALLDAGNHVRVLLHPDHDNRGVDGLAVERVYADLRDPEGVATCVAGAERVFHVAAKVSTIDGNAAHKAEVFDTNVLGTRHVLAAARAHGVAKVVVTGSFSAVGYHRDDPSRPADETVPFYPFHRTMPYEVSKAAMELEVARAAAEGLPVCIATSCAIIGGNDYLPSRLGRAFHDFANGKLRAYVEGGFEFVAARDVVDGHLRAMAYGRPGQKYILSTEFKMLSELIAVFADVTGVKAPKLALPGAMMQGASEVASFLLTRLRPSFPQRFTPGAIRLLRMRRHADTTKARTELGFRPSSVREAVEDAYAFGWERGFIKNDKARPPVAPAAAAPAEAPEPLAAAG